jgi:hypothetical protein
MLVYQNPTFQTEIEKPIDDLKSAVNTVFAAKKSRYVKPKQNELLNIFSCNLMVGLTLIELKIQLQKIDENKTLFKIEAQSPLGGALNQTLQRIMDEFITDIYQNWY